jgi:glycosyltransferase involved in cell wall biosynthesis
MAERRSHGVVFVGVGIFPHRVAGDKNFLLELSAGLRARGIPTSFVSIVSGPGDLPEAPDFTYVNRFLHRETDRFIRRNQEGRVIGYRHAHGMLRTYAELTSTLIGSRRRLRATLGQYDRAVVHWIDSSLLIPCLRAVCGERHRYVASMFRYLPQRRSAAALRAASLGRSHVVFTGTEASRQLLVGEGCDPARVRVGPWGCSAKPRAVSASTSGPVRLLWSGFLQQIGREDLLRTVAVARRVREKRQDVEFTFSLKPECFTSEFAALDAPGVAVRAGGQAFLGSLGSFDAFLSPVSDVRSTPAPPLTWLEAYAAGTPVITTFHPGVAEVVVDGDSGIVAGDYDDLERRLLAPSLKADLEAMRNGALAHHATRYEIGRVTAQYADVYRQLFSEQS